MLKHRCRTSASAASTMLVVGPVRMTFQRRTNYNSATCRAMNLVSSASTRVATVVAGVRTAGVSIDARVSTTARIDPLLPVIEVTRAVHYPVREAPPPPRGRFARPDRRRRSFLPNVQCEACKRIGHEAVNCDMLAVALFIERHKQSLSDVEHNSIESKWLTRWKE